MYCTKENHANYIILCYSMSTKPGDNYNVPYCMTNMLFALGLSQQRPYLFVIGQVSLIEWVHAYKLETLGNYVEWFV